MNCSVNMWYRWYFICDTPQGGHDPQVRNIGLEANREAFWPVVTPLSSSGTGTTWPRLKQRSVGKLERAKWTSRNDWEVEVDGKTIMKKANWGGTIFREKFKCEILEFKGNPPLKERGHYCHKRTAAAIWSWWHVGHQWNQNRALPVWSWGITETWVDTCRTGACSVHYAA